MKKCPICKNDMSLINNDELLICNHCNFICKTNKVSEEEEYSRYLNHNYDSKYDDYMQMIYLNIKEYLFGIRILDFGSGRFNVLTKILNGKGYQALSYDKYFDHNDNLNKVYDSIVMVEVLEHLDDFMGELKNLKSKLVDNGRIIIITNLIPKDISNWWYLRDVTHISFFSNKALQELSLKLNFKNITIKGNIIVLYA